MMMTLAQMKEGSKGVVREVLGGRGAYTKLQEMGIAKGKEIRVLRSAGALLVAVNGTKFVVGRGLAMKVLVDVRKEG